MIQIKDTKNRIEWIDVAKGIGIICIVLGHTLQGTGFLRQYLYAFSVPFFFFLVGLTYRLKDSLKQFWIGKLKRIAIPYIVFAVISVLIF